MAIDFESTNRCSNRIYTQAKIRNTEANDALKAQTLERVGETLIGKLYYLMLLQQKKKEN